MHHLVALAMALALCGCPERKQAAPAEAPMNLDKPKDARVQLDLAAARSAILKHQQLNGGNPRTLDELGVKFFHPDDLVYDASTGTVKSRTYPIY